MTNTTDNAERKAMIQKGFDTVASGYDRQGWWKCWQCRKQLAEKQLIEYLHHD